MSGDLDEFDALFEEIAAQRTEAVSANAAPAATLPPTTPAAAETKTSSADATGAQLAEAGEDNSDNPMFARLGGIVRLLHDSLRELGYDRSLSDVASEITDAQDRLQHVAALTEQAANKVLNAIDVGMPEQDLLSKKAKELDARWQLLFAGQLNVEEFKVLAHDAQKFSASVVEVTEAEKARLLEIMMAQDFQDITGQLIKKIVGITSRAESELAQLLRDNAPAEIKAAHADQKQAESPVELLNGPSAPAVAMVQDDVDSLLADLGF